MSKDEVKKLKREEEKARKKLKREIRDPYARHDFFTESKSMRVNLPLIVDEHANNHVTVYNLIENSDAAFQLSVDGALVLKQNGAEVNQIKGKIAKNGNDSFHIKSPANYKYPPGAEGECVAQVSMILKKFEMNDSGKEIESDSLAVILFVRRKLLNAFTGMWRSINGFAVNIGSSAIITSLVAIATFFVGGNLASLVPHFATLFVAFAFLVSATYSWYSRDRRIRKKLHYYNSFKV